eukprot:Skav232676  [mRNA]  locus=scaffold698:314890:318958:+ [translate_table: standard]
MPPEDPSSTQRGDDLFPINVKAVGELLQRESTVLAGATCLAVTSLNCLAVGGLPDRVPFPPEKLTQAQLLTVEHVAHAMRELDTFGVKCEGFTASQEALRSVKFDYQGEPVMIMEDLEADKVIAAWPKVGEAAIQDAVDFLDGNLREQLLHPDRALKALHEWPDRPHIQHLVDDGQADKAPDLAVLDEIIQAMALTPLMFTNLRAQLSDEISVTDASPTGGGAAVSNAFRPEARTLVDVEPDLCYECHGPVDPEDKYPCPTACGGVFCSLECVWAHRDIDHPTELECPRRFFTMVQQDELELYYKGELEDSTSRLQQDHVASAVAFQLAQQDLKLRPGAERAHLRSLLRHATFRGTDEGEPMSYAGHLLSAIKRFHPTLRLQLPISSQYFRNWQRAYHPQRAVPASWELIEAMMGVAFHRQEAVFALMLALGFNCFLRTSELLALTYQHLVLHQSRRVLSVILPGSKTSQGNPQVLLVTDSTLVAFATRLLQPGSRRLLFPRGAHVFRRLFAECLQELGFHPEDYAPYCLRRGGATWYFQTTLSYDATVARGRWSCLRTARQYIDEGTMQLAHVNWSRSQRRLVKRWQTASRYYRLNPGVAS